MKIKQKIIKEIESVNTSKRFELKWSGFHDDAGKMEYTGGMIESDYVSVYLDIPFMTDNSMKVEINWSARGTTSISDTKQFSKDMQDAVKIAEKCEKILIKHNILLKANFTGAWDKFNVFQAEVVSINRGNGFEDAVKVTGVEYECFIYMPPFKIENLPTKAMMFTFYADNGLYIKSK